MKITTIILAALLAAVSPVQAQSSPAWTKQQTIQNFGTLVTFGNPFGMQLRPTPVNSRAAWAPASVQN